MVKHAQRNHNGGRRKKSGGVQVGNKFRVDTYFGNRDEISLIDEAAKIQNRTRSSFIATAALVMARTVVLAEHDLHK